MAKIWRFSTKNLAKKNWKNFLRLKKFEFWRKFKVFSTKIPQNLPPSVPHHSFKISKVTNPNFFFSSLFLFHISTFPVNFSFILFIFITPDADYTNRIIKHVGISSAHSGNLKKSLILQLAWLNFHRKKMQSFILFSESEKKNCEEILIIEKKKSFFITRKSF